MHSSSPKRGRLSSLLIVALLGGCAVLTFSSCAKKASVAIIGKWQVQKQQEEVEFRKDGTVITSHETTAGPPGNTRSFKEESTGKYAFTDGSHMNLQIYEGDTNAPVVSIRCEVHINGDQMDMTMTAGGQGQQRKVSFKRLK